MQVTCFQSRRGDSAPYEKVEVPLFIQPNRCVSGPCTEVIMELPNILVEEEESTYGQCHKSADILTRFHNDACRYFT